ncbi:hypothetical protein A2U01_0011605, partial [Trifolium medium]|nr:hypothetical protein [Trifolium medium]
STWEGNIKVVDPSRIMGSFYRAGLSTRCTEQECWLVIPSRSGFGPARGPVLIPSPSWALFGVGYYIGVDVSEGVGSRRRGVETWLWRTAHSESFSVNEAYLSLTSS